MIDTNLPNAASSGVPQTEWTADRCIATQRDDLDALFASSTVGEIPTGRSRGTALIATGRPAGSVLASLTRLLFWKGKDFDDTRHDLSNRLSPIGLRLIRAEVRMDTSNIDGKPCIVLDYSKTSRVAKMIRDEIRQVGEARYIGIVILRGRRLPLHFFLDFS